MKNLMFGAALLALCSPAFADGAAAPAPADEVVTIKGRADMASYRDPSLRDVFTANLADRQIITDFKIQCQAAKSGFWKRQDQECAVGGTGQIINPANGKTIPRVTYSGGYLTRADGYADASQINVGYMAVGKVPASNGTFQGSLNLKPPTASQGAQAIIDMTLASIKSNAKNKADLIDSRIDTIHFSNFHVPSAGLPSDKGCAWDGDMVFSYQTNSWLIDVNAKCGDRDLHMKGNMGWPEVAGGHRYDLNLVLPSAEQSSDASLFVAGTAGNSGDLFEAADGISGQITQKEGGMTDTKVDGVTTSVATQIDMTGSLTGHNVPIESVRSLAQIIFILAHTFFGA